MVAMYCCGPEGVECSARGSLDKPFCRSRKVQIDVHQNPHHSTTMSANGHYGLSLWGYVFFYKVAGLSFTGITLPVREMRMSVLPLVIICTFTVQGSPKKDISVFASLN